ncbi:unnamed protein product [Adineta steineri]|uniref:Uncharacterized protein n=1 Tax=Adineta steineri TaxID=433720 RepID=A0A814CUQ4_9BILA|nr:unnamed protein product [Adineta steineri]
MISIHFLLIQFQLLSSLCSISQDTALQNQKDFSNSEFVTINLLHKVQFQSEVNGIIEFFKNSTSSQILTILNYLRTTTRANYLLSALNTNAAIATYSDEDKYEFLGVVTAYDSSSTAYDPSNLDGVWRKAEQLLCSIQNPIGAAGFFKVSSKIVIDFREIWYANTAENVPLINGFFGSCTPLEGLLSSTLACLYDIKCIHLLIDYFPAIKQIHSNWTDSVLYSKYENVSVEDLTTNLFMEAWSPKINYSEYFHGCAPSRCTYTTTDYTDFSYAVILLISLYGGLTIILRLIAPFLINISLKFKRRLRNTTVDSANKTINDHVHRFLSQPFIASTALTESEFETQLNATLDQFYQSTMTYFGLLVETVRLVNQVDQPFTGSSLVFETQFSPDLVANMVIDEITNQKSLQVLFRLFGTQDPNSTLINCICATGSLCQSPATIHDIALKRGDNYSFTVNYTIPGWIVGCSSIDTILFSTFECFYSDSDCFLILMNYIRERYRWNAEDFLWFDARPLKYNSSLSHFPPKTLISSIVEDLMIEQWNPSLYYNQFYNVCAPAHCTYSKSIRGKTAVGVMITLVSLISGLTVSLRLITPQLVKLVMLLVSLIKKKRQRQPKTQLQGNW